MTKKEEKAFTVKHLSNASTDVYLCCDTNLVVCLAKNDVVGFREYVDRIHEDYPGEL